MSRQYQKISYFSVFFWQRSSFIFRLRGNIILSGERNIIFVDNTRKIIFQRKFFEKTIFSRCLEKEIYFSSSAHSADFIFAEFSNLVVGRLKKFSLWSFNVMKLLPVLLISILSMTLVSLACLIPSLFIFAAVRLSVFLYFDVIANPKNQRRNQLYSH